MVEIGSYEGSSACWFLANMLRSAQSRLYCIDHWIGEDGEQRFQRFTRNIAEVGGQDRVEVLRDWSHTGLAELGRRGVKADFLYVDGSHAAPDVLRDLVLGFEIVRPGGIVCCDDYLWKEAALGGDITLGRPKIAIDAFTTIYGGKLTMVNRTAITQIFFRKDRD